MHSRDYIYEGKSTNNYVGKVINCMSRFITPYLISKANFYVGRHLYLSVKPTTSYIWNQCTVLFY